MPGPGPQPSGVGPQGPSSRAARDPAAELSGRRVGRPTRPLGLMPSANKALGPRAWRWGTRRPWQGMNSGWGLRRCLP